MTSPLTSSAAPTFNVTGLASGLDTNSIVQQLMAIDQQPEVLWQQQQTVESARKAFFGQVQTSLESLQSAADVLSDPSTWGNSQTVASSNSSVVSETYSGTPPAGSWTFDVTNLATAAQWGQTTSLTAANASDQLQITVGSTTVNVNVNAGDSIDTIASEINSTANVPVTASVSNGQLFLSSNSTGAANTMTVTSTGTLASDLGLKQIVAPADASYTVNGGSTQTSGTNTLTNVVGGMTITLVGPGTASITVGAATPNTNAITQDIQNFVSAYNSTVDLVYQKLNEQKVVNPTTDAQRESGMLNGDPGLEALLSALRDAVTDPVTGQPTAFSSLAQVGVSTGDAVGTGTISQDSLEGKLTVDSSTLASQLQAGFSSVKSLFTNPSSTDYTTQGIVQRLDGILTPQVEPNGVLDSRMSSEDAIIQQLQQQQSDLQVTLTAKETALRAQFAQMESTMSSFQSTGNWLSQQIAGLPTTG